MKQRDRGGGKGWDRKGKLCSVICKLNYFSNLFSCFCIELKWKFSLSRFLSDEGDFLKIYIFHPTHPFPFLYSKYRIYFYTSGYIIENKYVCINFVPLYRYETWNWKIILYIYIGSRLGSVEKTDFFFFSKRL